MGTFHHEPGNCYRSREVSVHSSLVSQWNRVQHDVMFRWFCLVVYGWSFLCCLALCCVSYCFCCAIPSWDHLIAAAVIHAWHLSRRQAWPFTKKIRRWQQQQQRRIFQFVVPSNRDVFSSPVRLQLSARVSFVLFTVYCQRGLIFCNGRVAFRQNKLEYSSRRSAISQ